MKASAFSLLIAGLFVCGLAGYTQESKNLAEKLGYPKNSKLLIIHADDLGLSHSTNVAAINTFESKSITSGSVMVTCPWISEMAEYAKNHPGLDIGIHLTLTYEWKFYKWSRISGPDKIPSVLNNVGLMYASNDEVGKMAKPAEAEIELKAQIDRAIAMGIQPTHVHLSLDNDEMQAFAGGVIDYGSAWRQKDLDYITSAEFKQTLSENNIVLITWKQIKDLMSRPAVIK